MRNQHIHESHDLWRKHVLPGDSVIDATCGNGHDTLAMAEMVLTITSGAVFAIDLQAEAIQKSEQLLKSRLHPSLFSRVIFRQMSHRVFPEEIQPKTISLIVYNLGYLPGGNKSITTQTATTLASLNNALPLVKKDGLISITCYPGHTEGEIEEAALLQFASTLNPNSWVCTHKRWINKEKAPSLLLLHKI